MKFQQVAVILVVTAVLSLHSAVAQHPQVTALSGRAGGQSSPAIAELDGDTSDGEETVIGTADGTVSAVRADGSVLWTRTLPNYACPFSSNSDKLYSSPVVKNIYGNGVPYVVIGYGGFNGKPCDGGVAAFRGSDGAAAWTFSIKKWAKKRGFFAFRNAVYSTPAVADVDGDGKMEIGFGAFDRNVYLLNSDGSVRWYYNAADTVFSSPKFVDLNSDGKLEMVIGTDISQNVKINPPTPNGGYLYAFKTARIVRNGFRYLFRDVNLQLWRTEFDQVVQSSPASGELITSNPGPEIVVGSGCFFRNGNNGPRGKYYKVVSARTGKVLRTLNVSACTPTGAAIADLDGDGKNEVIMTVSGDPSTGGDGSSHLLAWKPDTDSVMWDIEPKLGTRTDRYGGHFNRSPAVGDLRGDGKMEVAIAYSNGVVVVDGATGEQLTCDQSPCTKPLLITEGNVTGSPALIEGNGTGPGWISIGGQKSNSGALYKWKVAF